MNNSQIKKINSLRKKGMSIKSIAKTLHVSDKTVGKVLRPVKTGNKIEIPTKAKKPVANKGNGGSHPVPDKVVKVGIKGGNIVKCSADPVGALILGHSLVAYAIECIAHKNK